MSSNNNHNSHGSNSNLNLNALFQRAVDQGTLSTQSAQSIAGDLGGLILAGAAGMDAEDIRASEVTLVTVLIDASSSIKDCGLERAVCDGQNALLDAFDASKERDAVLVAAWTFDATAKVLHAYVPVADAVRFSSKNYQARGSTSLYDTFMDAAAANVAYAQTLRDAGTPVRSVLVVLTDGDDNSSKRTARTCKLLVADLLQSEQFLLGFVGVGDATDFMRVAREMGFPDECILVQKDATPSGIRKAFQMVSRSAIRASQGRIAPGPNAGFFAP